MLLTREDLITIIEDAYKRGSEEGKPPTSKREFMNKYEGGEHVFAYLQILEAINYFKEDEQT